MKFSRETSQDRDTSRIESFSDNVFAIALTLLVLAIKVPSLPEGGQPINLLQQLAAEWPSYVTYVISFITILLMWINHHHMFERVKKADHALMVLNGLMLLPVTLVPFPTSLLAVFISHPQAKFAAGLFSGCYVMIAGMYLLVWSHITRLNKRLGVAEHEETLERSTHKIKWIFVLYMANFTLGFIYPLGCVAACFLLVIILGLPELRNKAI